MARPPGVRARSGPARPRPGVPSSPPLLTTTIFAPAKAASEAASIVSSVPPEQETANTRDVSPTKWGHS